MHISSRLTRVINLDAVFREVRINGAVLRFLGRARRPKYTDTRALELAFFVAFPHSRIYSGVIPSVGVKRASLSSRLYCGGNEQRSVAVPVVFRAFLHFPYEVVRLIKVPHTAACSL